MWILESSPRGKKQKRQKNGKGKARKCIPTYIGEKSYPAGRPHARVVLDVDVQYFQYKNKVERGVKLKFSPLGASRGGGGGGFFKKKP